MGASGSIPEVGSDPYRGPVTVGAWARTVAHVRDRTIAPEPRLSTTTVMAIAAGAAALVAMFGAEGSFTMTTVTFALAGLVPWALVAGGVRVPPAVFLAMTMAPAAVIVLVDRNPGGVFPIMVTVVWIARSVAPGVLTALTVGAGAAVIVALAVLERTAHETGTVYFLGGLGIATLAGSMLRRQEVLLARLSDANARHAAHAVVEERTRIAREVHDVVAHSLTVTMLHVTGARRALEKDPDRAAEALDRAESVGRDSLESIRRIVGLLRTADDGAGAPTPLPELTDIPALVDQYRVAGMCVTERVHLEGVVADATTSLTAFRVVQEALANALQHAPGAPVRLDVVGDPAEAVLRIVAENPTGGRPAGRGDRAGLGLRGMAERVRAAGGTIRTGTVEADGADPVGSPVWRVEALLPIRAVA